MSAGLRARFASVLEKLSESAGDEVVISADELVVSDGPLLSDEFVVRCDPGGRHSRSSTIDVIDVLGQRESFRALGLAIVAAVFAHREITIELQWPKEGRRDLVSGYSVDRIVIDGRPWDNTMGFVARTSTFEYIEDEDAPDTAHPLFDPTYRADELPEMFCAPADGWSVQPGALCDTLWIAGPLQGLSRLAAMMLDIGASHCVRRRFDVESNSGLFQSLGNESAWVRMWVGFDYSND